jgi:hypothetical protein
MSTVARPARIGTIGAALLVMAGLSAFAGRTPAPTHATAIDAATGEGAARAAWLDYRAGERGDRPSASACDTGDARHRRRRAERCPSALDATRAWLDYRAGERGDRPSAADAARAWLDYRAGERAALGTR